MTGVTEFEISGIKYRAEPMDARRALHVALKLVAVAGHIQNAENPLLAIAGALSSLSPDDTDFVVNECLRVVTREAPGGAAWSPIMTPQGVLMFDDLRTSLAALIQIVTPVLGANVQGFLSELPNDFIANLAKQIQARASI